MTNLTEQQKRLLTEEVLEECWHSDNSNIYHYNQCSCRLEFEYRTSLEDHFRECNRTFDNPIDLWDLEQAIYRMGLWEEYCEFVADKHFRKQNDEDFLYHMHNPARCLDIAEWWEGRKMK